MERRSLGDTVSIPTQYEIDKALVSMALEHTLLDFGKDVFDKVIKKLSENDFFLSDCFDHPEYLNKILNEQFGAYYKKIIHAIQVWLGDSSSNQLISDFLSTVTSSCVETHQNERPEWDWIRRK